MILLIWRSKAQSKDLEDLGSAKVRLNTHLTLHSSANSLQGFVPQFPACKLRMTLPLLQSCCEWMDKHPCEITEGCRKGDVEWKTQILLDSRKVEGGSNGA